MRKRHYFLFILCVLPVIFFSSTTMAANQVTMKVGTGYYGEVNGEFIKVNIIIKTPKNIDGFIKIKNKKTNKNLEHLPQKRVELSAGTTKEFVLLIPNSIPLDNLEIVLEKNGQQLAHRTLKGIVTPDDYFEIGVFSDVSNSDDHIRKFVTTILKPTTLIPSVHPLMANEIPEQGQGLSSMDAIVINQNTMQSLSREQSKAIQSWVGRGGKLLISGPNRLSQGIAEIAPVEVKQTTLKQKLPTTMSVYGTLPTEPIVVQEARLKPGGIALHQQNQQVFVAKRSFHQGEVYYLAYDFTANPMRTWVGNQKLYQDLHIFAPKKKPSSYRTYSDAGWNTHNEKLVAAWNKVKDVPKPNLAVLAIGFFVYVIIVGPILYMVLALKQQKEKMWLVAPVCSIVAGLLIMIYGHWSRGSDVFVYNTGTIVTDPQGIAHVKGMSTWMSLTKDKYKLRYPNTFVWPERYIERPARLQSIDHQADTSLEYKEIPQWSHTNLQLESCQHIGGELKATVSLDNGQVVGQVLNTTKYPLHDVRLLFGTDDYHVGDLPAGGKKTFKLQNPGQLFISQDYLDKIYTGQKAYIFSYSQRTNDLFARSKLQVVGWLEEPMITPQIEGQTVGSRGLFAVFGRTQLVKSQHGKFTIPQGWLKAELISSDTVTAYDDYDLQYFVEGDGSTILSYQLPAKFSTISKLSFGSKKQQNNPSLYGDIKIYNFASQTWDRPPTGQYTDYISSDGRVLLKVDTNSRYKLTVPELFIEGR